MPTTGATPPPARSWSWQGLPPARDPRWGQVAALGVFCILGQVWLGWEVTPLDIALSVGTAVVADVAWTLWRSQVVIAPLSGVISGLGLAMLLRSSWPAVFVVAALLAIGSKHLITVDGHHRFNPSNFGLVVTLAFTQGGIARVTPGQWGGTALILFAIIGAGGLVVFRAQRLTIPALYLATSVVVAPLFHGGHLDLATSLGGDVLAFAFFMITDPKTAPATRRGQLVYAPALAVVGALFVSFGSPQGIFVAAFVVALVKPLFVAVRRRALARRVPTTAGTAPA